MPKNQDSLNNDLFNLLQSRGYDPIMKDSSGKEMPVPEEAEVFQFTFTKDDVDYGTVTVTIDGLRQLVVYYGKDVESSPKSGDQDSESWHSLLKRLSVFAHNHQLSFDTRYMDRLKYDMAKRAHNKLDEGYYPMGKKASYSDNVPTTKMIIKHTRNIEEGEQRYRNVEKIFIENADGERFLAPTTKPGIARVYARHVAEGGKPNDERWNHLSSLCEEYNKMAGFVRATRGNQFNESAQRLVNEGVSHYQKLRETLHKMAGKKGYSAYFESWTPSLMEDEEQADLSEMFMSSSLDPRIESVMPILGKLNKNLSESGTMAEVIALENWADEIITHKGGKITKTPTGIKHQAGPDQYGGSLPDEEEQDTLKKSQINKTDKELGVKWDRQKKWGGGIDVDEATDPLSIPEEELDEDWKSALAGGALAASMALGGMGAAHADEVPRDVPTASAQADAPASLGSRFTPGIDFSSTPYTITANGKDYTFAGRNADAPANVKGQTVNVPASLIGIRSLKAVPVLLAPDGKYYNAPLSEGKDDEADYGDEYQEMVKRVGKKAKEQEKAKQQQPANEGLDADQKAAGQLGPTEKVKNNNVGKLVGANESADLERIRKLSGL